MLIHNKFVLAALLLAAGLNVQADTSMVFSDTDQGQGKAASKVEISNGRARASSPGDGSAYMIFDARANQFTMIDVSRKTYMVFDQQQIQDLAGMQRRAMEQMEANLAKMPAAQRDQVRNMMNMMIGDQQTKGRAKAVPHRYVRYGRTETVAGHECEVLGIFSGDNKLAEQCVVGHKKLGIPADDYGTMKSMQEFIAELVSQFPMVDKQTMEYGEPGHDEIPVRYTRYSYLTGTKSGELRDISFEAIDASRFEIPKGYKRQTIPKM